MRKLFLTAALLSLLGCATQAGDVKLAWDKSPSPEVNAYRMYVWNSATTNQNPTYILWVGNGNTTNCTVSNLVVGRWSFALTAAVTNAQESIESDFSNTVTTQVTPVGTQLRLTR